MTKVNKKVTKNEERITSNFEFEDKRILEGYEELKKLEDETKTHKIKVLGKIRIPATYIAKMLETHYSFVHTILTKFEIEVVEKKTKSDVMREMFDDGYSISQVSKELKCHYSYVHGVHTRYMKK